MPLYVRDETVNDLATQAQRLLKTKTKTEAIRIALERVVHKDAPPETLQERLKVFQDRFRALGEPLEDFDEKAYLDEMWGNE